MNSESSERPKVFISYALAAERLHPKVANWRCRHLPVHPAIQIACSKAAGEAGVYFERRCSKLQGCAERV